ncbi:MAG: VOC family protein [Alphaproteobacteria bacterium]
MSATSADYAVPMLPSVDLAETRSFYESLGFTVFYHDASFLGLTRGKLELHFWPCADRSICEASGCYFQVGDVDKYHEQWSFLPVRPTLKPGETDFARISGAPEDRPWGMREFYLWDSNGNLIRIGSVIEAQEA